MITYNVENPSQFTIEDLPTDINGAYTDQLIDFAKDHTEIAYIIMELLCLADDYGHEYFESIAPGMWDECDISELIVSFIDAVSQSI